MPDVRVSNHIMERLGYESTYTLPQMIVGAILTNMDGRKGVVDLGHSDDDIVREMGEEWADLVRRAMAGDGNVNMP